MQQLGALDGGRRRPARRGFARSVTAFSPAGAWRSDEDYRAIATPFRIFYALVDAILFTVTLFAGSAWLRRRSERAAVRSVRASASRSIPY